ncbi:hypothetical protein RHMOL_Rhmol05G0064700 [Rhododendron molle]|uniref:Uncharacterized protein n=1 Tax=Rhododendron molle TaxID=49168 RepID=A0ACC0NMK0_RHOML|nr:hypothetical protein RHMOL_Rhmol05G0064700 [Rhododendron molle]
MAKEQVDRAEPPPPSVGNDSNNSQGFPEILGCLAFWIERGVADFLVLWLHWFPPNVWGRILFIAVSNLILSNSISLPHLILLLTSTALTRNLSVSNTTITHENERIIAVLLTEKKKYEQEKAKLDFSLINESKEEVGAKDGRNKRNEENTGQEKASSKGSKEEVKAKDQRNNKVDEESTRQEKAKLDFSPKRSKEEVKAKDKGNNEIDDKNTGQKKAEPEAKDGRNNLDEETSEKFQSSEAKRLARIKKKKKEWTNFKKASINSMNGRKREKPADA